MKFRLVRRQDLKKIQKLFFLTFKKKISFSFYKWRYFNPQSRSYVNKDNKIIFHVGFVEKKLNNKLQKLVISRHTSMVHKDYRRKGIYLSFFINFLKNKFINKKYYACVTWPNKNNIKTFKKIKNTFFLKKEFLYSNIHMYKNNYKNINTDFLKEFKNFFSYQNHLEFKKLKSETSFFFKDFNYINERYINDPIKKYYYFFKTFNKKLTLIIFSINKIHSQDSIVIHDYFGSKNLLKKSTIFFEEYFRKLNLPIVFWKLWITKKKPNYLKHFKKSKNFQNIIIIPFKKNKIKIDKLLFTIGDNDTFMKLA